MNAELTDENMADARLTSAAPDLLVALESLLSLVDYVDVLKGDIGHAARRRAHTAIARARYGDPS